jgi:hypothetical protein
MIERIPDRPLPNKVRVIYLLGAGFNRRLMTQEKLNAFGDEQSRTGCSRTAAAAVLLKHFTCIWPSQTVQHLTMTPKPSSIELFLLLLTSEAGDSVCRDPPAIRMRNYCSRHHTFRRRGEHFRPIILPNRRTPSLWRGTRHQMVFVYIRDFLAAPEFTLETYAVSLRRVHDRILMEDVLVGSYTDSEI